MFKIKKNKEKIFQNKILRSRDFRHEKKSLKSERMYNKNILREMRLPMPTSTYLHAYCRNEWMDDLRFYVIFNSISVISGRWLADNERICAIEPLLRSIRFPPQARLESGIARSVG